MMQITSLYGGPLEFLFVVESIEDPAYHAVSLLISDFKVNFHVWLLLDSLLSHTFMSWGTAENTLDLHLYYISLGTVTFLPRNLHKPIFFLIFMTVSHAQAEVDAKMIVAGLSTTCSQKIHNQLVGNLQRVFLIQLIGPGAFFKDSIFPSWLDFGFCLMVSWGLLQVMLMSGLLWPFCATIFSSSLRGVASLAFGGLATSRNSRL